VTSKIKFLRSKNADGDEGKLRKRQTSSTELREKFLGFFEKRGHKIVPSSSPRTRAELGAGLRFCL